MIASGHPLHLAAVFSAAQSGANPPCPISDALRTPTPRSSAASRRIVMGAAADAC
jgi:hypothetical protein